MLPRSVRWTLAALGAGCLAAYGCAASETSPLDEDGPKDTTTGTGGSTSSAGGNSNGGSTFVTTTGGGDGGTGGIIINPCDSRCGPEELCDSTSIGLDDDCDGLVDEGCPCSNGDAQACFKGDPSYRNTPGCFPGTQHCSELGQWGPCEGGQHTTDGCYLNDQMGCHALSSPPFVTVNLKDGTGTFSQDAISESWTVQCPSGVDPCPTVQGMSPADDYTPIQSGEYSVTYTKTTANGTDSCTYPLLVGAPGLRVELEWEHPPGDTGVDLDLHLHKPQDFQPWGGSQGSPEDCAYNNCTAFAFGASLGPSWFTGVAPPDPVNWYLDPVFEKNTCYFGPKGSGQEWQSIGQGCHNPRLDVDTITCDPSVTDPQSYNFCAPENINIDFPPKDKWTRIGVHYYSAHGLSYNVHPRIKIYCHGALAADLGPTGYNAPVTFTPADSSERFWLVADVLFRDDECDDSFCTVQPLYLDPNLQTPVLTTTAIVTQTYGPEYPPIP